VKGPPEEGKEVDENVGEGVGGMAGRLKWTCLPGIVIVEATNTSGFWSEHIEYLLSFYKHEYL